MHPSQINIDEAFTSLAAAAARGQLSPSAVGNIRTWLTAPQYAEYIPLVLDHIRHQQWRELDDAFWTVIPFGTAGRRGKMYAIGTNAINERTMGESAQGLANYILAQKQKAEGRRQNGSPRCAVAYDTRHRSREFAELCAEIIVAAGFEVLFFDGCRPTPELSFTVRDRECDCGIMISASHNPPSDNAIKVFWSTGVQLRPPHDAGVIECVKRVTEIRRTPFQEAIAAGRIHFCQNEQDIRYQSAVLDAAQCSPLVPREERTSEGPQHSSTHHPANHLAERDAYKGDLKIIFSPLHGVGLTSIPPILNSAGFTNVEIYEPHATPDGNFPNVPDQVANPENPAVFDVLITHAEQTGADLILASDPDADRIGCAVKLGSGFRGEGSESHQTPGTRHQTTPPWQILTGNQIGALLAEFLLRRLQAADRLTPEHYVVKTLVTSDMICRIAEGFGASAFGNVLTGFKWIGGLIDEVGPEKFVFGFEEAHGYLAGTYTRDKDGAIAALLLAELAAECKAAGKTLHDQLDELFVKYGCHLEKTVSRTLPGADGVAKMNAIMQQLRNSPPKQLGGLAVERVRDYLTGLDNVSPSDLLIFDLAPTGNRAAIRPSGTEPKLKFYLFAYEPPCSAEELPKIKDRLNDRLIKLEADLLSV
jgi:phosphomannomutase